MCGSRGAWNVPSTPAGPPAAPAPELISRTDPDGPVTTAGSGDPGGPHTPQRRLKPAAATGFAPSPARPAAPPTALPTAPPTAPPHVEECDSPMKGLLWTRPVARQKPRLSREAIVDAAITLADTEGLDAVSIRRVAAVLGVRPMSLYSHIARKDDLLDLMSDRIAAEILVPDPLPADWRDALRAISHQTRASCLRHPWMLTTFAGRPHYGPNALRHAEQSAAAVARLPVPPRRKIAILRAVDTYTIGHVLAELRARDLHSRTDVDKVELTTYLRGLIATGDYPFLAQLGPGNMTIMGDDAQEDFADGLEWLLVGITAAIES
ncbi:transcriptional regulator, TetR family [Frankia casuarinae]|nr:MULTISPECIES: TetR/AcrR family transcriptional regulator [unclassified Frankia]ETA02885.1 transcriptional regulator, TetR family [Frankia sp. CcI6]EYT93375.1 transcriptional regulator, TetR family [Frankia casuarinae]KEZ36826.1 transcriptional regulator, TetR family [Frankia sp. CeD]OAA25307.1 transcriptional regulator, tetR family [Frankia casuarinae]